MRAGFLWPVVAPVGAVTVTAYPVGFPGTCAAPVTAGDVCVCGAVPGGDGGAILDGGCDVPELSDGGAVEGAGSVCGGLPTF